MKTLLRLHQTSLAIMKETTVFDFLMSNIFTEEEETLKIFTFFTNVVYRLLQAHWILMSSSSRLVLEIRSHIIMSGNFTLLLGFSYAFSAKKKLKTCCVCVNIFNFFSYI